LGRFSNDFSRWMEKAGFILRKSDPKDERMTILEITPKDKETLRYIEKEKDEWLEVLLKGFSKEERAQLLDMVKRLIRNNVHFAQGDS